MATAAAIATAVGSLVKTGVTSRQKNRAERYHIGQCGSLNRSSSRSPPT